MQPIHSDSENVLYEAKHSPFLCIKCGQGSMAPVIEEGEPDFTEHYTCTNCGFQDTIPTIGIIASQFTTALIGLGISAYLLIGSFKLFTVTSQSMTSSSLVQEIGLAGTAILFASGFVYVMYQSLKGLMQRRAYMQPRLLSADS